VGQNPAGCRARPNSQHPCPHGPAERTRPSRTVQPSQPSPSSPREAKQSRGSRPHDAAPGRARPANPDPNPNLTNVRSCLPRIPPSLFGTFPSRGSRRVQKNRSKKLIQSNPQRTLKEIFDSVRIWVQGVVPHPPGLLAL
jgi:hypothetical protein